MNTKNVLITVLISIIVSSGTVFTSNKISTKKIGYIRTGVLLSSYAGMTQATSQYNKELSIVQNNIDTLRARYNQLANKNASKTEKNTEREYKYKQAEMEYEDYAGRAMNEIENRRLELTAKVLEEVNRTVDTYGKKKHYQLILGATDDGSILYGSEAEDLTNELLAVLNENYETSQLKKDLELK